HLNSQALQGSPQGLRFLRKGAQGEVDAVKVNLLRLFQALRNLYQPAGVHLQGFSQALLRSLQGSRTGEGLYGQVSSCSGQGESRLHVCTVIGGREEGRSRLYVRQRGKTQVGESIGRQRGSAFDHPRTGPHGGKRDPTSGGGHHPREKGVRRCLEK